MSSILTGKVTDNFIVKFTMANELNEKKNMFTKNLIINHVILACIIYSILWHGTNIQHILSNNIKPWYKQTYFITVFNYDY